MVERIGFVAGLDLPVDTMHCDIHEANLGVEFHLFLTIESHSLIDFLPCGGDEIARLNEHTTRAASRVKELALFRLEDIDNHLDERFGGEENAIVLRHYLGEVI